ncbi:hypothetical protein F2P81_006837 [Scophthalmus maximus]|uniref:Uncharacterized protein n=1 Tax=Scophthalmus maximus TaxID=52904 RepID=A0A6A4T7V8_SCOMX|nr:hypothetical protein F2P81_006837 [Scophthalmus maximus]
MRHTPTESSFDINCLRCGGNVEEEERRQNIATVDVVGKVQTRVFPTVTSPNVCGEEDLHTLHNSHQDLTSVTGAELLGDPPPRRRRRRRRRIIAVVSFRSLADLNLVEWKNVCEAQFSSRSSSAVRERITESRVSDVAVERLTSASAHCS